MRVVLIGPGNLGTNLALALHDAGHDIVAVLARTLQHAETLCHRVGGQPTTRFEALPTDADVYILSVKDSALLEVIQRLSERMAATAPLHQMGQGGAPLMLHTAGSMPMSVFEGYAHRYGVLYPMQTFSKERRVDFREIPVFIEASDAATRQGLQTLADSISGRVCELNSEQRKRLHLAAVFACNFANHCFALSAELLADVHVPFDVMLPLIEETARKLHQLHPVDAQTGPAVRYDENVIALQARQLEDKPLLHAVYELMSKSIHQTATEKHDQLRLTEDTSHRV